MLPLAHAASVSVMLHGFEVIEEGQAMLRGSGWTKGVLLVGQVMWGGHTGVHMITVLMTISPRSVSLIFGPGSHLLSRIVPFYRYSQFPCSGHPSPPDTM